MSADLLRSWRRSGDGHALLRLLIGGALAAMVAIRPAPAVGQEEVRAERIGPNDSITIEVRKGQVIRLPRPAATVFVADPEIADVQAQSPTIVYLFGRRAGSTSLYAVDENDQLLVRAAVTVQHNLSSLRRAIDRLLPESDLEISSLDGSIVLDGTVAHGTQAQELREVAERFLGENETLLNRIRVTAPSQVHLKVQVAEVSREVIKEFGINWESFFRLGDFSFAFANGRDLINGSGVLPRAPSNANASVPGTAFGAFDSSDASINAAIDALAEEGLVTILAEPNLTAMSGETASFLAGGEFPIPVASDDDGIEIEFKEFGISLAFTPTVLSGNRISLKVRPEVSELSEDGAITIDGLTIPALATRRTETTVELGSGQTFMVGGLLANNVQNAVTKFPGLGDLPVLGTLFRSQRFRRNETEVVILVTPYLVRPIQEPKLVARPTDGYKAPTDLERILEGRLHSARLQPGRPAPVAASAQRLIGPAGFVLE